MPTRNQPALRVVARDSDYSPSPPTDRHPSPSERSAESTRPASPRIVAAVGRQSQPVLSRAAGRGYSHPSPSSAESTRPVRWGGRGPAALDTEFHGIYGKGKRQASLSAT